MRVTKEQLIKGTIEYIGEDIIPQITDDKALQILLDIMVNSVKANSKLADPIFENNTVKTFLKCNDDGTYDLERSFNIISSSVKKYGPFPVVIPPIKYVSPKEKELSFTESDIAELKRRIERSAE